MHAWLILTPVILNLLITIGGFAKIIIQYEHRFTKLETEMQIILRKLEVKHSEY